MQDLQKLRQEINTIDKGLLELIQRRLEIVKKVGEFKKQNNLPVMDKKREEELLTSLEAEAKRLGINKELVKKIWPILFKEAYELEQ